MNVWFRGLSCFSLAPNIWQPFKQNMQIVLPVCPQPKDNANDKNRHKDKDKKLTTFQTKHENCSISLPSTKRWHQRQTFYSLWNKACKLFYLCGLNTSLANLLNPPAFIFIGNSLLLVEIKRPIVVQYILAQQPHVSFGKQERFVLFL